eukprot:scaffold213984_cov30-Tisochrysis_lutea.AAC.1
MHFLKPVCYLFTNGVGVLVVVAVDHESIEHERAHRELQLFLDEVHRVEQELVLVVAYDEVEEGACA